MKAVRFTKADSNSLKARVARVAQHCSYFMYCNRKNRSGLTPHSSRASRSNNDNSISTTTNETGTNETGLPSRPTWNRNRTTWPSYVEATIPAWSTIVWGDKIPPKATTTDVRAHTYTTTHSSSTRVSSLISGSQTHTEAL